METAKLEDIPRLTKLFCKNLSETFAVDESKISSILTKFVVGDNSEIWHKKDKLMLGVIQPSMCDQRVKIANCLYFNGTPKDRKIFEEWGKEKADMVMFNLPKPNRSMKGNGYKLFEVRYVKEL
jgi:hypothetical protein